MRNKNENPGKQGRLRICHVISSLKRGGAEAMLRKMVVSTQDMIDTSRVVSLVDGGAVGVELKELGVSVASLGMASSLNVFQAFRSLRSIILQDKPDVIQTWMYHADLLGGMAARTAGRVPVVWNIRHSDLRPGIDSRSTRFVAKLCAKSSSWLPVRIVVNSECGRQWHQRLGYDGTRMQYIPNAFDTETFAPADAARRLLLHHWQLDPSTRIVAMLGRFHPMKGYQHFLRAMRGVCRHHPDVRLLLAGTDVDRNNDELALWIREAGLASRCHLFGERGDVAKWLAGVDLLVSASVSGEGFSNVLGEAMACGVPCVATDVGDAKVILPDLGSVVEPADEDALTAACLATLGRPPRLRERLAAQTRHFIASRYSVSAIADEYMRLWRSAADTAADTAAGKAARHPRENEQKEKFDRDAA